MAISPAFGLFLKQVGGLSLFVLTCVGIFCFTKTIEQQLKDTNETEISKLIIQGDLHQVGLRRIQEQASRSAQGSLLFDLDVESTREALEFLPWVHRVAVRKRWPDTLVIHIQEQKAIARWNSEFYLNQYSEIFDAPPLPGQERLVDLEGKAEFAPEIASQAKQFQLILKKSNLHLNKVKLTPRHAWEITLEGGVVLFVGQHDVIGRLQRFLVLYPQIENVEQIEYIDLRYDTGLAVGWIKAKKATHDQKY